MNFSRYIAIGTVLSLITLPVMAQAGAIFTADDLAKINTNQTVVSCGWNEQTNTTDFNKAEVVAQLQNMDEKGHTRIQLVSDWAPTFSMDVPYSEKWMVVGKKLASFDYSNYEEYRGFNVGKLKLIDNSVQDTSCFMGRAYFISIEKGTLRNEDKKMRVEFESARLQDQTEGENLPTIFMKLGRNTAAMIPNIVINSGGTMMVYGSVSVQKKGYVITINAHPNYRSENDVDAEMMRIAASLK